MTTLAAIATAADAYDAAYAIYREHGRRADYSSVKSPDVHVWADGGGAYILVTRDGVPVARTVDGEPTALTAKRFTIGAADIAMLTRDWALTDRVAGFDPGDDFAADYVYIVDGVPYDVSDAVVEGEPPYSVYTLSDGLVEDYDNAESEARAYAAYDRACKDAARDAAAYGTEISAHLYDTINGNVLASSTFTATGERF